MLVMLQPIALARIAQAQGLAHQPKLQVQANQLDQPVQDGQQNIGPIRPRMVDGAWLADRIADLGAADLATRDNAQLALRTTVGVDLARVEVSLDSGALSPEQFVRLSSVGLSLFVNSPRPAMGVEFGGRFLGATGVTVTRTVQGFESTKVLESGDVILSMDGFTINDFIHARQIILSFDPGELVTLSIIRRGEPTEVSLHFGSFKDLPSPSTPANEMLGTSWGIRRERRSSTVIEIPIVALDPSIRPNAGLLNWREDDAATNANGADPANPEAQAEAQALAQAQAVALAAEQNLQLAQSAWYSVNQWLTRHLDELDPDGSRYQRDMNANTRKWAQTESSNAAANVAATGGDRIIDGFASEPFSNRPLTPDIAAQLKLIDGAMLRIRRELADTEQRLQNMNIGVNERIALNRRVSDLKVQLVRMRQNRQQMLK